MPKGHERVMTADGQTLGAEILNWASQISRHQPGNQHEFPQDVARAVCNMLGQASREIHGDSQIDYRILIRLFYQAPFPVEKTRMFHLISKVP